MPLLRSAIVSSIQHLPRQTDIVTRLVESQDQLFQKGLMNTYSKAFDVFKHEGFRIQLSDDPNKF
ncbi:hypothetical protein ASE77_18790 [Sphingomonas sp. Leaf226]|nr:hypothetical protein ASE77_18790 [Sphingomonas sp. Leaf226]